MINESAPNNSEGRAMSCPNTAAQHVRPKYTFFHRIWKIFQDHLPWKMKFSSVNVSFAWSSEDHPSQQTCSSSSSVDSLKKFSESATCWPVVWAHAESLTYSRTLLNRYLSVVTAIPVIDEKLSDKIRTKNYRIVMLLALPKESASSFSPPFARSCWSGGTII